MRKKTNSILNKLKGENQAIQKSSNILSDIDLNDISKNTALTRRIDEIIELQNEATLESSNQITQLMQVNFQYEYPFDFKVLQLNLSYKNIYMENYKNSLEIKQLIKTDSLKNHVIREVSLNSNKNTYNKTLLILNKIDKFRYLHDNLDVVMFISGCLLFLIVVNLLSPISHIILWMVYIYISLFPGVIMASLFKIYTDKIQKDIYEKLNKNLKTLSENRTEIN
jgi:hypothetical protein